MSKPVSYTFREIASPSTVIDILNSLLKNASDSNIAILAEELRKISPTVPFFDGRFMVDVIITERIK